jgi:hypothetical protein
MEEVKLEDWLEKVYKPDIQNKWAKLDKKRAGHCAASYLPTTRSRVREPAPVMAKAVQ